MLTDAELFAYLPSNRKEILSAAIGRQLIEIERLFTLDLPSFLEDGHFNTTDYFSYNCGPIQFHFEGDLIHVLCVWGEQLSVVILTDPLHSSEWGTLYRLADSKVAPSTLKNCLGQVCQDVRIWTLKEDFESEEAKEVAVSYVFSNELELFYCIYLHEDLDSDYLLIGKDVPREKVATCFSLLKEAYIDPWQ